MLRIRTAFLTALITLSVLWLVSSAHATRSRLSGMGGLSIVIEDESNMLNLWDFAGNPAAFLEDEEGSWLRGDFIWDTYDIVELPYYDALHWLRFTFDANGNLYDGWGSLAFRKDGEYGLGLTGDYLSRSTDAHYDDHRLNYPNGSVVLSKSVNPRTFVGLGLTYGDYDFDYNRLHYMYNESEFEWTEESLQGFQAQLGLSKRLASGSELGLTAGYERMSVSWAYQAGYYVEQDHDYYIPYVRPVDDGTCQAVWLSGQFLMPGREKLRCAAEWMLQFLDNETNENEPNNRFYLRFRGLYDASSRLTLGFLFSGSDSRIECHDPVHSYFSSIRHKIASLEWGAGLAFRFHPDLLAGIEYHWTKYREPSRGSEPWDLRTSSLNAGLEAKVGKEISLLGGCILSRADRKLKSSERGDIWQNTLTLGCQFRPVYSGLTIDLSIQYAFKNYKEWYGTWDVESTTRILSFSLTQEL
jgi:opacity protein-like surface antigen